MKLFNRKRYFIVFYRGGNNIGNLTCISDCFFSRNEVMSKLSKEIGQDYKTISISGIFRITKKEYDIWNA